MLIDQQVASQCCELADDAKLLVAYSGGLDSHVLLHALSLYVKTRPSMSIRAIHIDHQLQSDSADWADHCQRVCDEVSLSCQVVKVDIVSKPGESMEAAAREARYAAIAQQMQAGEIVLTAQHQDDQAETLLLQLMRGAGVRGLAAMPAVKRFACGVLMRPLLSVSKADLLSYADHHQIQWIEDVSNQDIRFDRNFLRHQIMPLLKRRWPKCSHTLARSAAHCATASAMIKTVVELDYGDCYHPVSLTLSVGALLRLPEHRCLEVIRYWIEQQGFILPDTKHVFEVLSMLHARNDAQACVHYKGVEVRRHVDDLYVMKRLAPHDNTARYCWDLKSDYCLPGSLGVLSLSALPLALLADSGVTSLEVCFRCGGETVQLAGHQVSKTLKNCFNEWGVPPWQRDRVPLLYFENKIVMVWGFTDFLLIK